MRTPAGVECRYYYEDFNRGREIQECRLLAQNPNSLPWEPDDCSRCPVPEILRANGSPHLRLEAKVTKKLGLFRRIEVASYCLKHAIEIEDPIRGCRECAREEASLDARR